MERLTKLCKDTENGKFATYVVGNYTGIYSEIEFGKAVEKLAFYENLEEQEKLIILPCKVGDKIYDIKDGYIYEFSAEKIEIRKEDEEYIYCIDSIDYRKDDFGKIAFLTEKKAEQALAKMKEA